MAAPEPRQSPCQDLEVFGVTLALSPTSTYPRLDSVSSSLKLSAIAVDRAIKGSFFCTEPRIWERSGDTAVPGHTVVLLTTGHHGRVHGGLGRHRDNKGFGGLFNAKTLFLFQEHPKLVMVCSAHPVLEATADSGSWAWRSFGPPLSKAGKAEAWHPRGWQGAELG